MGDDKPGEISIRSHVRGVVNLKTLRQAVTDACVFCLDNEKLALEILIFIKKRGSALSFVLQTRVMYR